MTNLRGSKKTETKATNKKDVAKEEVKKDKVEDKEVEVKVNKSETKQPLVRIKPNQDIRTYIGDSWYNFKKGKQVNVPQQVKDILAKSGKLDPL